MRWKFREDRARRILKAAAAWKSERENPANYFGNVLWVKIRTPEGHVKWVPEGEGLGVSG